MRRGIPGEYTGTPFVIFPPSFFSTLSSGAHPACGFRAFNARKGEQEMTRTRMIAAEIVAQIALAAAIGICASIVLAGAALLLAGGAPT
jgi:hypothetical protein